MASGSGSPRWESRVAPSQVRATSPRNETTTTSGPPAAGHARSSSFFNLFRPVERTSSDRPATQAQLHPEIRSVVQLTLAHAHKIYVSGPLVRRIERLPDGHAPGIDDGWRDVWAQLGGTTLSVWDMAEIEEANREGREVPPTYINITDAFVTVLGAVTIPTQPAQRHTNVVTVNSAGSNMLLFACPDGPSLIAWSSALRLAAWEKARLEEIYTAHLLRITLGPGPRSAVSPLVRGKMEGFVRVRVAGQTDWKRLWMVVSAAEGGPAPTTPPTERKRRISALFGAPAHVPQPEDAILRATVGFYAGQKGKDRKRPMLSVVNVTQAFAVYPERPELINRSTLLKLEGTLGDEDVAASMRGREGWVLVMPELEAGFSQAREMLKWLIGIHDAFELYGRPKEYVWDPRNIASLMFAYPVGPARDSLFLEREAAEQMDPREDRTSAIRAGLYHILANRMRAQGMLHGPPDPNPTFTSTPSQPTTDSPSASRKVSAPPTLPPPPLREQSPVSEAGKLPDAAASGGGAFHLPPLKFGSDEGESTTASSATAAATAQPTAPAPTNPSQGGVLTPIHQRGSGDTMGTNRTASGNAGGFGSGFVERFGNESPRGSSLDKEKEGPRVTSPLANETSFRSSSPLIALDPPNKPEPVNTVLGNEWTESPRNLVESPRSGFRLPSQERDFEPPVRRQQPPTTAASTTSPPTGEARFSVVRSSTTSPNVDGSGSNSPIGSRSPHPADARQSSFSTASPSQAPPKRTESPAKQGQGQSPPGSLPHSPVPPAQRSPRLPSLSPPAQPDSRDSFRTAPERSMTANASPTSPPELGSRDSFRTSTSSFAIPSASVSRAASSTPSASGVGSGSGVDSMGLGGRYEVLPSANASSDVHAAVASSEVHPHGGRYDQQQQGMGSMGRAPGSPSTFGRASPFQQAQQQGRMSPYQQQQQQGRNSPYQQQLYPQQNQPMYGAQQLNDDFYGGHAGIPDHARIMTGETAGAMTNPHSEGSLGGQSRKPSLAPSTASFPMSMGLQGSYSPGAGQGYMQQQQQQQQLPLRFATPPTVPASPMQRFATPPVPSSPLARQGMNMGAGNNNGDSAAALAYMAQMDLDPRPPRLRGAPPPSMEDETEEGQLDVTEEDLGDEDEDSSEYHGAAAYGVAPLQRRSLDQQRPEQQQTGQNRQSIVGKANAGGGIDRRPTGARAAPPPASNRRSVALEPNHQNQRAAAQRSSTSRPSPPQRQSPPEMDENADALAALSFLDQPDEEAHPPAQRPQQPQARRPEPENEPESEQNTRAPSPAGSQYRSSFAPSKAAAARKAKSEAHQQASLRPGRAPGGGKAKKSRAWGDSSEEEDEEDEDDVDSDGEPAAERARPPRNLPQVPQGGPKQQQQGMYPPQMLGHGQPPMHGPYDTEEPYAPSTRRAPSDTYGSTAPPRSMFEESQYGAQSQHQQQQQQQPALTTHAPVPSIPRNIWNQVLDPSAPQPQPNARDTFVQLEAPEATMTKAFTPHGLLSAGLQDKQDRSAKKQEELARETGASLINVPHKPPPPQTGLLGAITAHERERKREGGVGAALTEREREKRAAEERQRKIDELQRQQLEAMTQNGGSMYGGNAAGYPGMMNPMMLNPMMSMYGMMPQMTGMGMGMNPYAANQQHLFAAQQAQQAYQQAMMSFSQAGSQAGDTPQITGGGPGSASPAPGQMHPMMTGGSFADPRMSMMMNPMLSPMMTGGMNPMMGMGGMNPYMMGGGSPMMTPAGGQTQSGFFSPMDRMGQQQQGGVMMQAPPSMGELSSGGPGGSSRNGSPARGSPLARPPA